MNLFSNLGGVEMIIKKKQEYLKKRKNQINVKKESSSNFRVVYATKEEIDASASKILKKYAETFRRLAE